MRRNEREITDLRVVEEILTKSYICRLGLYDDKYPYVVPLNYGYHDNSLYFHCALQGKKIELIKKNNRVGFEIEESHSIIKHEQSCKWTTKFRSVIGNGTIKIISDIFEKKNGLDIIMQHHGKTDNVYDNRILDNVLVLKLSIENLSAKQSGV